MASSFVSRCARSLLLDLLVLDAQTMNVRCGPQLGVDDRAGGNAAGSAHLDFRRQRGSDVDRALGLPVSYVGCICCICFTSMEAC